ncbi:hypothetical protein [Streptomyces eurythermus]|uniref:hypothetical protein n=1 Tax=Streptomyces eurythermus TaxID=42237 RepID=UPI0036F6DDA9
MPVTINAHQLGRLIDRTIGHIGDEFTEPLHGIRLEADTTFLYAIASDRYTVAAARYRHHDLDAAEPFARTLPATCLPSLREWTGAQPGSDPVSITLAEGRVRFTTPRSELGIAVDDSLAFFDWRGILRGVIEQADGTGGEFPVLDTRLLGRFAAADDMVRVRVTADQQAILLVGEDFLGAQMPARTRRDGVGAETLTTLCQVHTLWQPTLSVSEAASMADGIPAEPGRRRYEAAESIAETVEDLLKHTLRTTHDMFSTDISSQAFAAYAASGVMAWSAYRYLEALHRADPKLAAAVVAETAGQLDDGAIGEWARDAAKSAGHAPEKWQVEFDKQQARRKNGTVQPGQDHTTAAV